MVKWFQWSLTFYSHVLVCPYNYPDLIVFWNLQFFCFNSLCYYAYSSVTWVPRSFISIAQKIVEPQGQISHNLDQLKDGQMVENTFLWAGDTIRDEAHRSSLAAHACTLMVSSELCRCSWHQLGNSCAGTQLQSLWLQILQGLVTLILGSSIVLHIALPGAVTCCYPGALVDAKIPHLLHEHLSAEAVISHVRVNNFRQ